jgi:hypothetical protein
MNINFILYGDNQQGLINKLNLVPPTEKHLVTVKPYKSQRSLEQNKWARKFASDLGKQIGYDPQEAYDILMYQCNPVYKTDPLTGNEIRLPGHLSDLKTDEAAEVQDRMIRFGQSIGFFFNDEG